MEWVVVLPGARVNGVCPDASLNSGQLEVMAVSVVVAVPAFLMVIVLVVVLIPMYVLVNVRELGLDVICAEAVTRKSTLMSKQLARHKRSRRMTAGIVRSSGRFTGKSAQGKSIPAQTKRAVHSSV